MEQTSETDGEDETSQDEMPVGEMEKASGSAEEGIAEMQQVYDAGYAEMCFAESEKMLEKQWKECRKNPGHKNFIPVDKFTLDHLPSKFREPLVLNLVMALAGITVRLISCLISEDRPKMYRSRSKSFPHYHLRGNLCMVNGTGRIYQVEILIDQDYEDHKRTCVECQKSPYLNKVARIWVRTSTHVVYDDSEAKVTTCYLSLNGPDSIQTLRRAQVIDKALSDGDLTDMQEIWFETHNLKLAQKLKDLVVNYEKLTMKVTEFFLNETLSLFILVSHPHGMRNKYVSVGNKINLVSLWKCEDLLIDKLSSHAVLTYNAPTCPGSSGASFVIVGHCDSVVKRWQNRGCHSARTIDQGFNRSSISEKDTYEWSLQKEAMEQGVTPGAISRVTDYFLYARERVLRADRLEEQIEACEEVKAELRAENVVLEEDMLPMDLDMRVHICQLVEKWKQELEQLCRDLELSLQRVMEKRDSGTFTMTMVDNFQMCVICFLNFDENMDGKLDGASFKSLFACLRNEKLMMEGDCRNRLIHYMVDSLDHDSTRLISLKEFTDLLLNMNDSMLAMHKCYLRKEAKELGVEPEFSEPVVTWYSETRHKLLFEPVLLEDHLEEAELLNSEILSESEEQFLKLLDKVQSADLTIREHLRELALKWRDELQQLCQELKRCFEHLWKAERNGIYSESFHFYPMRYLSSFLNFDKNWTGRIDHDSFKSLVTRLCDNEEIREGDPRYDYIQSVLDRLHHDRKPGVSLMAFTDLLVKTCNKTFAKIFWCSLNQAKEEGVEPEFSESVVSWYSESRFQLVTYLLGDHSVNLGSFLNISEGLTEQIESESEDLFLQRFNNVPSGDSDIREGVCKLALKWRLKLQKLCQDLEFSLKRMITATNSGTMTQNMARDYLEYLFQFLELDKNVDGKIDSNSFKTLMTQWRRSKIKKGDPREGDIQAVMKSLDQDGTRCVSVKEFTDLMLKICNRTMAKDRWYFEDEAVKQGVELGLSEPITSWFADTRFKFLHMPDMLENLLMASEELTAQIESESEDQFFERMNKVSSQDRNIREGLRDCVLKWRQELQQLCQDLEVSVGQLMDLRARRILTKKDTFYYLKFLSTFLHCDENRNGKLDYASFKSFVMEVNKWYITENHPVHQPLQLMIASLDRDRGRRVSLMELTDLLSVPTPTAWYSGMDMYVERIPSDCDSDSDREVFLDDYSDGHDSVIDWGDDS